MDKHFPLIRNIPLYGQFSNGCGLSSLLMLLNIQKDPILLNFFEEAWGLLDKIFKRYEYKGKEYRWSLVLQYLLLKIIGYSDEDYKQEIYDLLNQRMNWAFEDIRFINKSAQESIHQHLIEMGKHNEANTFLHYIEINDLLTPVIIFKNLHIMKTDMELKVLAEIFDYEFIYQSYDDITGAISFNNNELRKRVIKKEKTKEKWLKLEEFSNDPNIIMIYGKAHHWLAIRGIYRKFQLQKNNKNMDNQDNSCNNGLSNSDKIKERKDVKLSGNEQTEWLTRDMIIELNDPAQKKVIKFIFRTISMNDRILIFKKRASNQYPILAFCIKIIKQDNDLESEIFSQYLEKREENNELEKNQIKTTTSQEILNKIIKVEEKENNEGKDNEIEDKFLEMIDIDEELTGRSNDDNDNQNDMDNQNDEINQNDKDN